MIELHNIDCMDYMSELPDNAFELAIVDPPYGIGESNKQRKNTTKAKWKAAKNNTPYQKKEWDNSTPNAEYFIELKRVSKNQIIWGGNYMTEYLSPSMGWIFWDKKNGDSDFSDGELAWSSFDKALRKFEWLWNGFQKKSPEKRIHPTQKPIKLYEWLLINYAKEGDRILDTHLGSGSIAVACHNLGFDLVGCELDTDYFNAAQKRLKLHQSQLRIPMN